MLILTGFIRIFVNMKDVFALHIANKLKLVRKNKGISQMQVADMANIHFTYYSQIERAIRKDVSVRILKRITEALGVTFMKLFINLGRFKYFLNVQYTICKRQ